MLSSTTSSKTSPFFACTFLFFCFPRCPAAPSRSNARRDVSGDPSLFLAPPSLLPPPLPSRNPLRSPALNYPKGPQENRIKSQSVGSIDQVQVAIPSRAFLSKVFLEEGTLGFSFRFAFADETRQPSRYRYDSSRTSLDDQRKLIFYDQSSVSFYLPARNR